ncbi:hypothetical protein C817_02940 [Dorea sp. 5-2]|nr:hypothetical protein C817_02940 [Dorea sp. 5-2]
MKEKIDEFVNKIPEAFINIISIISGMVTIITPIVGYFKIKRNIRAGKVDNISFQLIIVLLIIFVSVLILMFMRIRKYRKLMMISRSNISEGIYQFLHDFRNLYFGITKTHKDKQDSISTLTREVREYMRHSLDGLCAILNSFTRKKICACIKLIETEDGKLILEDKESVEDNKKQKKGIDIEKATVRTFVRSTNSDLKRGGGDKSKVGPKLRENTAFMEIIDSDGDNTESYFYKGNLLKYEKELSKTGRIYKNSTVNWKQYYKSTIIVPIRIAHEHLYHTKENEYYDIIGFLCIDSLSTQAFLKNQERYNCLLVKAFAAEMYVVLSKYRYYLRQIDGREESNGKNN